MPGSQGVFTGGGATVIMDPPPLVYVKVFRRAGAPDRELVKRTRRVAALARVLSPKDTGQLAASIRIDRNRDEKGRFAFGYKVYTNSSYAHYVHEGTAPSIRRVPPGQAMKFHGTNASSGQTVFARTVHHPGNSAEPFLQNALIAMVR